MSRSYKINKTSHDYATGERVSWLDQFANQINQAAGKTAVEVARYRNQLSMQDQINSVLTHKSHLSVDNIVKDMQERTGLNKYLQSVGNQTKKAQQELSLPPHLKNDIINYIKNNIATHHGNISIPAVQYDILSVFGNKGLKPEHINNNEIASFINTLITEQKRLHPHTEEIHIGDGVGTDLDSNDSDNTDFLKNLMPNNG